MSRSGAWAFTGVLALILWRRVLGWWQAWRDIAAVCSECGRRERTIAVLLALILWFTLLIALAPPVKFDALVYHLALPKHYLQAGRIEYVPENMFWGMPQLVEMLYTWVIALAGDRSAPVLSWMIGCVALTGLIGHVAQLISPRAAWIAAASLLSGYSLAISLSWGYVDWAVLLFGWAFLASMIAWRSSARRHSLLAAAVFAGFALGTKYTAGILLVAGLAVVFWELRERRPRLGRSLFIFSAFTTLTVLPWWVKNWLATGNPFYPLLFPAGSMDAIRLSFYQVHEPWGDWRDVIFLPLRATFLGLEASPGYGSAIGPFLLALGGLVWVGWPTFDRRQRSAISTAGIVAVVGFAAWAAAGRLSALLLQTRFYLSIFPALALIAAGGYQSLTRLELPGVRLGHVVGALIVFVLGLNTFQVTVSTLKSGAPMVVLNLRPPQEYLADNLGWYAPAAKAVGDLPESARVLMLWEARGYYCMPKCTADEVLDRWVHDMRVYGDPQRVLESWQQSGFSHLLFYRTGAEFIKVDDPRYHPTEWIALESLLGSLSTPEDYGHTYELYSLLP